MAKLWVKTLNVSSNPSGAAQAARQGNVVMIVDLIDMSTTAESALEAGVIDVLGASPDKNKTGEVPVKVNPEKIGYIAGKKSLKHETEVVVAAEPRLITAEDDSRLEGIQYVLKGLDKAGGVLGNVVANLGKDICKMVDLKDKILVVVSAAGGTAYDAAYNYGAAEVITGTVARTNQMSGSQPADTAAQRAINAAKKHKSGISIIAASSNSVEDILGADYIKQKIIDQGYLKLDEDEENISK